MDKPAFVLYALIGNDVCNGHEDTVSDMTTPEEMRANVLSTLAFLVCAWFDYYLFVCSCVNCLLLLLCVCCCCSCSNSLIYLFMCVPSLILLVISHLLGTDGGLQGAT